MRIVELVLHNWMAFEGTQRLELPALPIAIVGQHGDNGRRSNWAGKTALLEAIGWALHGVSRKRTEDALIHRGTHEVWVQVTFDTGDIVRRIRPRGGPTRLSILPASDRSGFVEGKAAEELIDRLLAMSSDDMAATVVFAQGDTEALVGMKSSPRRALLVQWLELDRWAKAGEFARVRMTTAANALDVAQSVVAAPAQMTRDQIAKERAQLELDEASAAELELDGDAAAEELRALHSGVDHAPELARVIEDGKQARADLKALTERSNVNALPLDALKAKEAEAAADLAFARRNVEELGDLVENGFDGMCPVMLEECPAKNQVGANVDQHAARVTDAQQRHTGLVQLHRNAANAVAEEGRRVQAMVLAKQRLDRASARYKELHPQVVARAERIASADTAGMQARIDAGRAATTSRAEARARLRYLTVIEKDIETREADALARVEKLKRLAREVKILAAVNKALSPTGISQKIAASQLVVLEDRANAMLAGTGLSFTFGWERETQEPAPVCYECGHVYKGKAKKPCPTCSTPRPMKRSDELEILVDDGSGEIEDVRAKSGGARVLVASAIRLAGGAMLRDLKGSRVAWAIVDEPFGPLDAENREMLARTFAGMLGSVGLEQAFVVSHDAALLDALPARIVVHREGGASRATVEA